MEILLTSKFEQKDEIKALGAKWSAGAKRWFVDAGETIESIESAKSKFLKFIDAKELSGVNFVIGNQPVNKSKAFILFNKKADVKLQKAVNDEMEKLKSDGTLLKLSKKYLGGDYVPKN